MKIGFIGIGNMGGAILSGYAESENSVQHELFAFDMNEELCTQTKQRIPALKLCESGSALCAEADITILGVKPQVIEGVLEGIADAYDKNSTVVSMAAGVDIEVIERYLGKDAKVIRIMPNTPAKVGEAMIAMCMNDNVNEAEFKAAEQIFSSIGMTETVDESMIDCTKAVRS